MSNSELPGGKPSFVRNPDVALVELPLNVTCGTPYEAQLLCPADRAIQAGSPSLFGYCAQPLRTPGLIVPQAAGEPDSWLSFVCISET
jgi:hypothetical protein